MPRSASPLSLEFILLGLLQQQPMHGYDLHKTLQTLDGLNTIWLVKLSQLYALLEKLENEGLLNSDLMTGSGLPVRKLFSITPQGGKAFDAWLLEPVSHPRELRQAFLAKLYFARLKGASAARELIAQQKTACQTWLEGLADQLAQTSTQSYAAVVLNFRITQIDASLKWLTDMEKHIINPKETA